MGISERQTVAVQLVFDEYGPERDRGTDWWRCQEQPWFDLASALVFKR